MKVEVIKLRLKSLGYEVEQNDFIALDFVMKKVEQHIKHFCNISEIPACLEPVFVDMCCGEFLQSKKSLGQLTSVQIEPIVKKIQDGDTNVEFSSTVDAEVVFSKFIDNLINGHNESLLAHRKLVW
ncbi:MAG: hypothetical protein IKB61_00540 [Elusimicrobiaceae bacterium]|nr:hypothetical protein [Elusimicrobiaceae bacterium]